MYTRWLAVSAFISLFSNVNAQSIDPNSVPLSTRDQWCNSQITQCPLICLQTKGNSAATDANSCDPTTLIYSCVCSNGISPNASEYSQTIPYYECTEFNTQCVANCGSDNTCAAACRQDHPCGATDPTRVNTSTISTMPATTSVTGAAVSTGSGGVVYTGFGGSSSSPTSAASSGNGKSAATRLVLNMGELYGIAVVTVGIFAGFTIML